jgi:hypothetical protein
MCCFQFPNSLQRLTLHNVKPPLAKSGCFEIRGASPSACGWKELVCSSLRGVGCYIPGTGFPLRRLLRLASDDLQGYGGGINLPQPGGPGSSILVYILQELDGQVQSQSKQLKSRYH